MYTVNSVHTDDGTSKKLLLAGADLGGGGGFVGLQPPPKHLNFDFFFKCLHVVNEYNYKNHNVVEHNQLIMSNSRKRPSMQLTSYFKRYEALNKYNINKYTICNCRVEREGCQLAVSSNCSNATHDQPNEEMHLDESSSSGSSLLEPIQSLVGPRRIFQKLLLED